MRTPSRLSAAGFIWMSLPSVVNAATPSLMCRNRVLSLSRSPCTSPTVFFSRRAM